MTFLFCLNAFILGFLSLASEINRLDLRYVFWKAWKRFFKKPELLFLILVC